MEERFIQFHPEIHCITAQGKLIAPRVPEVSLALSKSRFASVGCRAVQATAAVCTLRVFQHDRGTSLAARSKAKNNDPPKRYVLWREILCRWALQRGRCLPNPRYYFGVVSGVDVLAMASKRWPPTQPSDAIHGVFGHFVSSSRCPPQTHGVLTRHDTTAQSRSSRY